MENMITVYTFGSFKTFFKTDKNGHEKLHGTDFGVWLVTHKPEEGLNIIKKEKTGDYYVFTHMMKANAYCQAYQDDLSREDIVELCGEELACKLKGPNCPNNPCICEI